MATIVKLTSGLKAHRLTESEQNAIWNEISINTSPIGSHSLFTPNDNLEYFIVSERELSFDKFEATIKANGKSFKVKYNVCTQDEKTLNAVRKAYGK